MKRTEAGQAFPLTLMLTAMLFVAGGAGFGIVYEALHARSQAQTAADAAALAGVAEGEAAARLAAHANNGRLVRFETPDGDALVTVEVGSVTATARAHQGRLRDIGDRG